MLTELKINPTPLETAIQETVAYHERLNWPKPEYGINEERKEELIVKLRNVNHSSKAV
ncbi:MAG: hypothetical protein ACI85O_001741 [Saprospiraceae bacterium]|jgi:hypothetical protein